MTPVPPDKLDIFTVLNAVDKKNHAFLSKLTPEQQKEVQPFVVTRWLSGTGSARQIMLLNEVVNPYNFSLTKHKELLWKLLTVCGSGRSNRYTWMKLPSKASVGMTNIVSLLKEYYNYSDREAIDSLSLISASSVRLIAAELGKQPDDMAKITKEAKNLNNQQ